MKNFNFGKIGVLMGGSSTEREISLKSGIAVYETLKRLNLNALCLDIKDEAPSQIRLLLRKENLDICFVALHGRFGEDGGIQEILQEMNISYTGSGPSACRLSMDKILSRRIFEKKGIPVPRYIVLNHKSKIRALPLKYPLVTKPASQGSSVGVSFVERKSELKDALNIAFSYDSRIIIEEYVKGREITVGILEDKPLPVIEIIPQRTTLFSYQAKYSPGFTEYIVPARLPQKVLKLAKSLGEACHRAIGCKCFSRVDMILDKDNIYRVLEVNSIPGLTETSLLPKAARAEGINYDELILRILKSSLKRCQEVKESRF